MINHKELLKKYIKHVKSCEGVDFIPFFLGDNFRHSDVEFEEEELKELWELSEGD